MSTHPDWLKDWRKLRKAGAVCSAFPTERWIEEWEREHITAADLRAMIPASTPQDGAVASVAVLP